MSGINPELNYKTERLLFRKWPMLKCWEVVYIPFGNTLFSVDLTGARGEYMNDLRIRSKEESELIWQEFHSFQDRLRRQNWAKHSIKSRK